MNVLTGRYTTHTGHARPPTRVVAPKTQRIARDLPLVAQWPTLNPY